MAFKSDTDDMREASSVYILRELLKRGASRIVLNDPIFSIPNAPEMKVVIDHFLDYSYKTFKGDEDFKREYARYLAAKTSGNETAVPEAEYFKKNYFPEKFIKTGRVVFERDIEKLGQARIVFLVTEWPQYKGVDLRSFQKPGQPLTVVDGRNLYYTRREEINAQGLQYLGVGTSAARSEIRTTEDLIEANKALGGGELQGFRGVTEKITDGIWSLTAHTYDAVKLVASIFGMATARAREAFDIASAPATANEQKRFADARKVLLGGKTRGASDVLILAPEFGVDLGAALLMRKIVGDAPVAVLVRNDADRKFLARINLKLGQAHRPLIFPAATLPEAAQFLKRAVRGKMNIKPMVYSGEKNAQADLLLQQYGNAVITVTPGMYKSFLNLTGVSEVITRLRDEYLATARSA